MPKGRDSFVYLPPMLAAVLGLHLFVSACQPPSPPAMTVQSSPTAPPATLSPAPAATATASPTPSPAVPAPEALPSLARRSALTYDAARGEVLRFGGWTDPPDSSSDSLWAWGEAGWRQLHPATIPPGRIHAALAFDGGRQRTVLFGGRCEAGCLQDCFQDTWLWDGLDWQEQHPPVSPSSRLGARMVYDAARGVVLLFGGFELVPPKAVAALNDTWTWDGQTWTLLQPPVAPPPARTLAMAMAYDGGHQTVVLVVDGRTWLWDGQSWHEQDVPGPSADFYGAMEYDQPHRQVVLCGASVLTGALQTWLWDGAHWRRASTATSLDQSVHADESQMVYDARHRALLLFTIGGNKITGFTGAAWAWTGEDWAKVYNKVYSSTSTGLGAH